MHLTNKATQNFRIAYTLNIVLFALLTFIIVTNFLGVNILINNYLYFSIFIVLLILLHVLIVLFTKSCYTLLYELQINTTDYKSNKNIIVPLSFTFYAILLLIYSIYFIYLAFFSDTFSNLNQKISAPLFFITAIVSNYVSIKFWLLLNIKNKLLKNAD